MTTEGHISEPPSAGRMLAITAGALVAASLIVFGAILPAEFNWDPLGLGRVTGLNRLWAPREVEFDTATAASPGARISGALSHRRDRNLPAGRRRFHARRRTRIQGANEEGRDTRL